MMHGYDTPFMMRGFWTGYGGLFNGIGGIIQLLLLGLVIYIAVRLAIKHQKK